MASLTRGLSGTQIAQRLVCRQKAHPPTPTTQQFSTSRPLPGPTYVDRRNAPDDFDDQSAVVYPNIISPREGEILAKDILKRMKRRRYEKGHWDAVITNYKEIELPHDPIEYSDNEDPTLIPGVLDRIRNHLRDAQHVSIPAESNSAWLPCHAIDLKKDGELNAHVDSIKFSGDLVAGLSLLSPCIMRLRPDPENEARQDRNTKWVDLFLPPLSLYALTGVSRYAYSHELLPSGSTFERMTTIGIESCGGVDGDREAIVVDRDQRLSVIFRDAKEGWA